LGALLNRRMLICVFTGFASGLPLYILISLLPAWLKTEGLSLAVIGGFALIQFPYTWKFLWAPLVDRYALPWLGRRRSWMLIAQIGVLACVWTLGAFSPASNLQIVIALTVALALLGATLDIALDAYRRELLREEELGLGNAVHVNAYKIAGLVPGSLALVLADHLPWSLVFLITALFMLPGIAMVMMVSEPNAGTGAPRTLREAVIEPFHEFIARSGWRDAPFVLGFIFLYKLGDSMCTALATPFYLEMGFSKSEIGLVAKHAGLWPNVIGGIVGGLWMVRLGINRALWLFGTVQLVSIFGFAWLAARGPVGAASPSDLGALGGVIGLEALGVGLGTAAFVAFIARATDPRYTATQFALFTSVIAVPRTFINAGTGWLVERMGWFDFFLLCGTLAVPGMLLLLRVAPWNVQPEKPAEAAG
jgi:PAT family beta-lactamase induction signal transducer AmpG